MTKLPEKDMEVSALPQPSSDEFIVWYYNLDKLDVDEVNQIHLHLQKLFPNNMVVGLPDDILLDSLTKEELLEVIDLITKSATAIQCERCHKWKYESSFYTKHPNGKMSICKDCLKESFDMGLIDNNNPRTFNWILKEINTPFIESEWNYLKERYPNSFILGRYLAKMALKGFKNFTYDDTEELNRRFGQE